MEGLKRDYTKQPLQYIFGKACYESIDKEDLEYLFCVKCLSLDAIGKYLGVSRKYVKKYVDLYNLERKESVTMIRQNTLQDKYGEKSFQRIHYGEGVSEILDNKEILEQFIKDNNIESGTELAEYLNISNAVARRYIVNYHLKNLMNHSGSLEEKRLREYINKFYKTENNTKEYLENQEIDIYIPELKIGVEFNGNYWHNENRVKENYHQQKSLKAEEKGIFLYHVFEYEWLTKKDKIINQLNNLLKINEIKIGARKCVVKEVNNKEKREFLELNHLQGNDKSNVKLGLYYNDELVSLMTFCKPRFNKKYQWELSRYCSKAGYTVNGAASRLFKAFIKTYKPESIISYSNLAHTRGNLYEMLGFKLDRISEPNYVWNKHYEVLSRYKCQKHKLVLEGYSGKSEADIMHKLGYYKIYDCGNKVWVWNK